jgi:Na+/proline symporter
MATEVQNRSEQSMTSLVSGIVGDVQDLIKQQLALTRKEIEADLRKTRDAATLLAVGIGLALFGCFALCLMLAHLLHYLTTPAALRATAEPAAIPLWGCYCIVTAVLLGVGGALAFAGKKKFDSFNPLPDESAQALKENIEWIANKK